MFYPPSRLPFNILFLLAVILLGFFAMMFSPATIISLFGLIPAKVTGDFWLWQMVTYMALHGGLLHLLFNMLALYMFGTPLVHLWGPQKFNGFFLFCGIGAAITTLAVMWGSPIPTIGASGAIYGLLYAWAKEYPDSVIYLYGLFPMRAKHFVIMMAIVELLLSQTPSPIARFAHLGGLAFGWMYYRLPNLKLNFSLPKVTKVKWERSNEVSQDRVDQILEKISRKGIASLTENERRVLEKASSKKN